VSLSINGGVDTLQFVYGHFVDNASINTLPSITSRTAELLRSAVSESLVAW
jgi:hypothetical protein